jgi:hypothetical protein
MDINITYFENTGVENTAKTLELAKKRALELNIKKIVLASTHGFTALEAAKVFKGNAIDLIAVSISPTFSDMGWNMTQEERLSVENAGVKILTTLHSLADGVAEGFYGEKTPGTVMADTLRCFCQGMKVAVEVAIMALEAGLVNENEEIIAIGGTGEGCDTAIVIKPAYARKVKDTQIYEVICKPRIG